MDFLDLEVPDHGSPRSRDRKLRIAMKTLQSKGSGLAERPLDPVERIGNPSNKSGIRQTNLEIRQTDSDVERMAPGPPKSVRQMANGLANPSNKIITLISVRRILVEGIPSNKS